MAHTFTKIAVSMATASVLASTAYAGGFSRGTADTDILFEEGNFNIRTGVTYVAPQRNLDTINGVDASLTPFGNGVYSDSYAVPTAAIALKVTDNLTCGGALTQVYGGGSSYEAFLPTSTSLGNRGQDFTITETGATCRVGFDAGIGEVSFIGGGFIETLELQQIVSPGTDGVPSADDGVLSVNGQAAGYRLGVAFSKPEIALRAQLLYRSQTQHSPSGQTTGLAPVALPTTASGTLPRSVELRLQSGVAAGTLVFGSVKWTEWSSIDVLNVTIAPNPTQQLEYFWKNGWTVTGGVARQLTDQFSVLASLTWDQGVSTTEDIFTDTWTLGAGVQWKPNDTATFRFGGGLSYLTAGSQSIANGAAYDATVGNDLAYAASGSVGVKF